MTHLSNAQTVPSRCWIISRIFLVLCVLEIDDIKPVPLRPLQNAVWAWYKVCKRVLV